MDILSAYLSVKAERAGIAFTLWYENRDLIMGPPDALLQSFIGVYGADHNHLRDKSQALAICRPLLLGGASVDFFAPNPDEPEADLWLWVYRDLTVARCWPMVEIDGEWWLVAFGRYSTQLPALLLFLPERPIVPITLSIEAEKVAELSANYTVVNYTNADPDAEPGKENVDLADVVDQLIVQGVLSEIVMGGRVCVRIPLVDYKNLSDGQSAAEELLDILYDQREVDYCARPQWYYSCCPDPGFEARELPTEPTFDPPTSPRADCALPPGWGVGGDGRSVEMR
eukprot:NODE_1409_length_968_cov_68.042437_g1087_i0.p1 GENE.NODE_1409_length_968_cov_68.042437_g1087_i0~~NODE_1409_length_968_cov_68.042437_g1087_i0.p1  ORF type:complete len:284 (+),score=51.40 NODE_1409_length_968_cov_68.042437_g1087_i0:80-931(+)